MKQTATNYLIEQLELKVMAEHMPWVAKILDTAIEMEREQIIEAYERGEFNQGCNGDAKQYYSDTYIENRDTQS
jgi:hypothetical protein